MQQSRAMHADSRALLQVADVVEEDAEKHGNTAAKGKDPVMPITEGEQVSRICMLSSDHAIPG